MVPPVDHPTRLSVRRAKDDIVIRSKKVQSILDPQIKRCLPALAQELRSEGL
jgi:hypothetical protein